MLRILSILFACGGLISAEAAAAPPGPSTCDTDPQRAVIARGRMETTLARIPVTVTLEQSLTRPAVDAKYQALGDRDCQCRAARQSSLANLFAEEAAHASKHRLKGNRLGQMQSTILVYSEAEARNMSAGAALDLYYRLADAEARWEVVRDSITAMDSALAKTKELMKQRLAVAGDYEELLRQRIDLQSDALQLEVGIERLNAELKQLLGMSVASENEPRIWPAIDVTQEIAAVDPAAAVKIGLARRPQLVLLRILPDALTPENLPAARLLLRTYNVLLAMETPAKRLKVCAFLELLARIMTGNTPDLDKLRTEVAMLAEEREQSVAKDIRMAAEAVNAGRQKVALASEQARIRKDRLADVDAKAAKGIASFKDTTTARLEWLRARSELIKSETDLLSAWAKLREAQGTLAQECGFGPPDCGE